MDSVRWLINLTNMLTAALPRGNMLTAALPRGRLIANVDFLCICMMKTMMKIGMLIYHNQCILPVFKKTIKVDNEHKFIGQ